MMTYGIAPTAPQRMSLQAASRQKKLWRRILALLPCVGIPTSVWRGAVPNQVLFLVVVINRKSSPCGVFCVVCFTRWQRVRRNRSDG